MKKEKLENEGVNMKERGAALPWKSDNQAEQERKQAEEEKSKITFESINEFISKNSEKGER